MIHSLPELSLVVLIGVSGSGKSSFAKRHFKTTEVLSSDTCRGLVSDDENNQAATPDAFDLLQFIARKRLAAGKLTVVDATNVQPESRKPLVTLAREYHCIPVAFVFNLPERIAHDRNKARSDRTFGPHVIRQQSSQLKRSLRSLKREGFRHIHTFKTQEEVDAAAIERVPLWNDRRAEHGPFDIIGDVHGCHDELTELLTKLGYILETTPSPVTPVTEDVEDATRSPAGRIRQEDPQIGAFETDANRGEVDGTAAASRPLLRHPEGRRLVFLGDLVDRGPDSPAVLKRVMRAVAAEYRGPAIVVYGHTPIPEPEWLNRTINLDTGCVFGGRLTALRYPENELVSVQARKVYSVPAKPLDGIGASLESAARSTHDTDPGGRSETTPSPRGMSAQQAHDDLLDFADVSGKRIIGTRLHHDITIRAENATAALEVMSRFAANPKWLIYLPPTMSPCETHRDGNLLEHPAEAFEYYRGHGVTRVVCQQKHMGSRAVVIVCRDETVARNRFGVAGDTGELGICYTRTGRRFFDDAAMETEVLERVRTAVDRSDLWNELSTDWLCLDCELMPWSTKARSLLLDQYAPVGVSAEASLTAEVAAIERAIDRGLDMASCLERTRSRRQCATDYVTAYGGYCWPVQSVDDLKLAPFHLLASEGAVHADKPHDWHMEILSRLASDIVIATPHRTVDLESAGEENAAIEWWLDLTAHGGEGMVVKPLEFIARSRRGLIQPAVKCRGREYLRIIYGPEYTLPENLERLRARGLNRKRSLALREFALGVESLERFVRREPLRRVHECVFGVLALESEPVDPRL